MNKRDMLVNVYGPDILEDVTFLEPEYLDEAIIGLAQNDNTMMLVYSEPCIIRLLKERDGMTQDKAVEHFNQNTWYTENVLFVDNEVFE